MLTLRRAGSADAAGMHSLAHLTSYANANAASAEVELSRSGFLFYPLANAADRPNYLERITASAHCWVAEQHAAVVGFMMAYTFDCLNGVSRQTDNDRGTLDYFLRQLGMRGNAIYLAQVAVHPDYRRHGIFAALHAAAFDSLDGADHPAVVAEVAQAPLWNQASTRAFTRLGYAALLLRDKPAVGQPGVRCSAVFIKTLACRRELAAPIDGSAKPTA